MNTKERDQYTFSFMRMFNRINLNSTFVRLNPKGRNASYEQNDSLIDFYKIIYQLRWTLKEMKYF